MKGTSTAIVLGKELMVALLASDMCMHCCPPYTCGSGVVEFLNDSDVFSHLT
jgi:hypothetical protein